jgi:tyrosyl-tRNA synthetase
MQNSSTVLNAAALLSEFKARGLFKDATPGLEQHLAQPRTLYCGFDPTADSLHIGSLVPLLALRRLQQAGHRVIILVGGATGMIGDPSFKATERKLLDDDALNHNVRGIEAQVKKLFANVPASSLGEPLVLNNADWTKGVGVLDFLREIGKHFSVNQMIARDSVKTRLERDDVGISFTEFAYALLQAFDFHEMFRNEALKCSVQIGASDQWGNMTAGTELIRKKLRGEAHVLTLPLLTKADGTKFGKSESGTVWLDAAKTSPYAFYQFWLNTADADVEKYLKLFSFLTLEQIHNHLQHQLKNPENRGAQVKLAEELTVLVHGQDGLSSAQRISAILFGGSKEEFQAKDYLQLAQDGLPSTISAPQSVIDGLVAVGLAASKREARDFLKQGAIQHNGVVVTDEVLELTPANAKYGKYHLLKRGKKQFALLVHG